MNVSGKLLTAIALLAVVLVAGAIGASQIRWGGGSEVGGYVGPTAVGLSVATGSPFTIMMTEFRPAHRTRIESIRLHDAPPGLTLVGVLVHTGERGRDGLPSGDRQFPPANRAGEWRPARGAIIPAHTRAALFVGLRAERDGAFRQAGVDVFYREDRFGIELRRREHAGLDVHVCAVRTTARVPRCKIPDFGSSR